MSAFFLKILASMICLTSGRKSKKSSSSDTVVKPGSFASHHLPIEAHHSLQRPFDVSLPYWKYGGSTVATESLIRLTPNSQSRAGWLFNEFSLSSKDWELELHYAVRSSYHIGGDGMGIFVLSDSQHPRRNRGHNYLAGGIFGLKEDFDGFGVILDTYDNDGGRDNPSIYTLKQSKDDRQTWNGDNDYADNMVTTKTDKDSDIQCTNSYRNMDDRRLILRFHFEFSRKTF